MPCPIWSLPLRALPVRLPTAEIRAVADGLRRTLAGGSNPAQLTTATLVTAWLDRAPAPDQALDQVPTRWHRLRGRLGWLTRLTRIRGTRR